MSGKRRVALGMSGGVDSAVSAALLARAGYEVVGVTCVFQRDTASECAVRDAAAACRRLGIAHVAHDCADAFGCKVVAPFISAYVQGLTPSPCVGCNANMKIPSLMDVARAHGCDWVATGHYARVVQVPAALPDEPTAVLSGDMAVAVASESVTPNAGERAAAAVSAACAPAAHGQRGIPSTHAAAAVSVACAPTTASASSRFAVMRALDARKDQSYMLAMLSQEQLSRLLLPLGAMTKVDVRLMAADLGLEVAEKPDSQDICFIDAGYGDYRDFLRAHGVADEPGSVVDGSGRVLGQHAGLFGYTVGQRKGIGIAASEPYYVLEKRMRDNALVVGFAHDALIGGVIVGGVNWQVWETLDAPCDAMVKLRYRSKPVACIMEPMDSGRVRVRLRSPQQTTAPGQFAVFYQGDTVLGGGMIEEVLS